MGFDSLWFSNDSGLYRSRWFKCTDLDDFFGSGDRGDCKLLSTILLAVDEAEPTPRHLSLLTNYPNPFNPTTTITYDLPMLSPVRLTVYNLVGRQVAEIENDIQQPGHYQFQFNGSHLASGVYFLKLQANGLFQTTKMVLLK